MELIHQLCERDIFKHSTRVISTIKSSIISLENLASKTKIFRIVKEQHDFMLIVRSKDRSATACAARSDLNIAHHESVHILQVTRREAGGARRDRTADLMLAKHALSQLSYGPVFDLPDKGGGSGRSCTSDLTLIRGAL